ncbi:hypothetical protein OTU49_012723 [Cherax quadricarinatus]|uniref:Uncharacterized protein n=1 Tax=Cherax quadricarinatus TaxID=27406 RepID=A0AAW0VWI8_CHEQU
MFGNIHPRGTATCPHHTHQDHVVIYDNCVASFANDMMHLQPKTVTFELLKRPSNIPGLREALQVVAMRDCEVNLFLRYDWQLPRAGSSDEHITILTQSSAKCRVTAFSGCLSGLVVASLPATINQLWLAFTEDDDHMRNALSAMTENIARMEYLWNTGL